MSAPLTEEDILRIIAEDERMMGILRTAEELHFSDWLIGAGFVRNKVWDHLHGRSGGASTDIDLVYFDPNGKDQKADEELSERISKETGLVWEIVNEAYAHTWNGVPPYTSTEDAIAHWPETATAVGVRLRDGELALVAPYGIADLMNLTVRPSPLLPDGIELVRQRMAQKRWMEKWPNLKIAF